MILVVADRYVPAWPGRDVPAMAVDVWDAMTRAWPTDAHHTAYAPATDPPRRLSLAGIEQVGGVRMVLLLVDVDGPDHGRTREWDADVRERVARLPGAPWAFWTRGGARIVYAIDRVVTDADDWARWYLLALVAVAHMTGIIGDPACADPTRLYRLPHATRDGELQRLGWILGAPTAIGPWPDVELEEADLLGTLGVLETTVPAWRRRAERLSPRRVAVAPPATVGADGERALAWAAERVAGAGKGDRNAELFRRARWIGGLVDRGELARDRATHVLAEAAGRAGLGAAEARRTIASAIGSR